MTIPIPECTEQEVDLVETPQAARHGAGVGFEPADAELEFECGNGKLTGWPSLVLDFPLGAAS